MKRMREILLTAVSIAALSWAPVWAMTYGSPAVGGRSISLGSLTMTGVYPRIFTPNGDGANDKAVFHFDNPELLPVSGAIFDFASLSFHVPMCGLAAKQAAVAINDRATATTVIRVFIMRGFRRKCH